MLGSRALVTECCSKENLRFTYPSPAWYELGNLHVSFPPTLHPSSPRELKVLSGFGLPLHYLHPTNNQVLSFV